MKIVYEYDYVEKIKQIYNDARWEAYYDMAILPLLEQCCPEGVKCVPIHETRKAGRKSKEYKKHFIETYSGITLWKTNGKLTTTRTGIPDYVIVPDNSSYDSPQKAIVNIEIKIPKEVTGEYVGLAVENHKIELIHQLSICKYIILTDGITWHFIVRNNKTQEKYTVLRTISLYDDDNKKWKQGKRKVYSNGEVDFYNNLNIEIDENEEVECDPPEWEEIIKSIRNFIRNVVKKELE